mgnify:CR=1 FL=1
MDNMNNMNRFELNKQEINTYFHIPEDMLIFKSKNPNNDFFV